MAILRIVDNLNKLLVILLGIAFATMSIVIFYQVMSRYFIGTSITWSEELARYLMAYIIFVGASVALRHQELIAVEFISDRLSSQPKRVLKIVINIIGIIFFAILFMNGMDMIEKVKMQESAALQIPMSIPYASIPIGAILMTINSLAVILELITKKEGEVT